MHAIAARDGKRVGGVDKTRQGTFLFNYFVADDANVMLKLWDYLTGWYAAATGLDNSTLLVPLDDENSDYLAINNARWDGSLPVVMYRQLSNKSFWTCSVGNLDANRVGPMPILYRRADLPQRSRRPMPPWAFTLGAIGLGTGPTMWRMRRACGHTPCSR